LVRGFRKKQLGGTGKGKKKIRFCCRRGGPRTRPPNTRLRGSDW